MRLTRLLFYYQVVDTAKGGKNFFLRGEIKPRRDTVVSNIEIFKKYPETGVWSILTIAQFVFWVVICCISVSLIANLVAEMRGKAIDILNGTVVKLIIATTVTIAIFICTFLFSIYDDQFQFQDIFLENFKTKMIVYGSIGYFTAGILLFSFLLTTFYVRTAKTKYGADVASYNALILSINEKTLMLKEQLKAMNVKDFATATSEEIEELKAEAEMRAKDLANVKEQYRICKKYFNFFFSMAAIVLSVLVIWMGILFSAINSLNFFVFLRQLTGQTYLPYDFVYLYGALHSLLLLIFFVPMKLRMINLSFSIPDEANELKIDGIKNTFKNILVRVVEILAASSPLLTAILQKALE